MPISSCSAATCCRPRPVRQVYVNGRLAFEAKTTAQATVIQAGRIYTGAGEVISQGAILIEGTTVRGLGRGVSVPPDAKVRRYEHAVIVPGFLDLSTGLGLGGPLSSPVPLQTKLGEQLVSSDAALAVARQGGVTTVLLASTSPTPSPVLAFKLGDQPRVVQEPVAIRFGITGNLTSQAATRALRSTSTRMPSLDRYQVARADYERKARVRREGESHHPRPTAPAKAAFPRSVGPHQRSFRQDSGICGSPPCRRHQAGTANLPRRVQGSRVLLGADDAFRMADVLAENRLPWRWGGVGRTVDREPINLAQVLVSRGVPFGFRSNARAGVKSLPLAVQYAVHRGLGADDALTALPPAQQNAGARQNRHARRGKDADLVVLSGALQPSTRVLAVMIDGKWVYESDRLTKSEPRGSSRGFTLKRQLITADKPPLAMGLKRFVMRNWLLARSVFLFPLHPPRPSIPDRRNRNWRFMSAASSPPANRSTTAHSRLEWQDRALGPRAKSRCRRLYRHDQTTSSRCRDWWTFIATSARGDINEMVYQTNRCACST